MHREPRVAAVNLYVGLFAADALASALDGGLKWAFDLPLLSVPRDLLAWTVVLLSLPIPLLLIASPRLPFGLLFGLCGVTLWMAFGTAPVPMWFTGLGFDVARTALQALAAAAAFAFIRRRTGAWFFPAGSLEGPAFSLAHSGLVAVAFCVLGVPATAAYSGLWLATEIHVATHGFLSFDLTGVNLGDRSYVRGDREIRLVGMMHLGESDEYQQLVASFIAPSTVVLEEGVTDVGQAMEVPLSYAKAASAIGLAEQDSIARYLDELDAERDSASEWPELRHADVDLGEFSPATLAFLERSAEVWDSDDPVAAFLSLVNETSADPETLQQVQADVIDRRNAHLLGVLDEVRGDYAHVIVPWGALHLPALEEGVLERGFEERARSERRLLRWSTIARSLSGGTRSDDAPASTDP